MAVRKPCRSKGCKTSPRCEHPWWLDVMHNHRRYRMPVYDVACLGVVHEERVLGCALRKVRLRLVLLRDPADEHPQVARRAEVSKDLAEDRGVAVTELVAEGDSRLERLASLVGPIDYATVYLGIALGVDPTPVVAIQDLKERIAY